MKRFWIPFILLISLSGCTTEPEEVGIVARVNGRPIALSQLEFQHDLMQVEYGGSTVPSVKKLRDEYGKILGDLIVQELILQELENHELGITSQELERAEAEVRADYPEGAFEQVLIEEYIDLKAWRQQLLYHLGVKKFYAQFLRPKTKIDYKEAEAYYKEHISDFILPDSLKLLVLRGPNSQQVEMAIKRALESDDPQKAIPMPGPVSMRETVVREARLPASWRKALTGVEIGQATAVISEKTGAEALILLEQSSSKVLSPTQAYPLVEEALLDKKIEQAFSSWLDTALTVATIEVSKHLIPTTKKESLLEEEEATPSS